jgi:8-oxo-dGTP pyrophosphatase MutT (NUDIX family)
MDTELPLTKVVSSGLIVVRRDDRRFRFLALRGFSNWDFLVAALEGEADPLQAAIDETREVTGISDLIFPWGEEFRDTLAIEDGQVSRYYVAQTNTEEVLLQLPAGPGSEEDYEYRWVTAEEAEEILPPRLAIVLDWVLGQLAAGIPVQNR